MTTNIYYLQAYTASCFLAAMEDRKLDKEQQSMLFLLRDMIYLGMIETAYIYLINSDLLVASAYNMVTNDIRQLTNE